MYAIVKRLLFLMPAEKAHYCSMGVLKMLCAMPPVKTLLSRWFQPRYTLSVPINGLVFKNPVGLGAGFDKNARYLRELEALGFGFVEIGTVTPRPQNGNPKPRLFRLTKDQALINRMGFNNEGVNVVAERLKQWRQKQAKKYSAGAKTKTAQFLIGGNIGKNKDTANEDAWKDYEICFKALHSYVDFFVVNVSSPNTPGLRALQEKDALKKILTHLQQLNTAYQQPKPIFLKIAPDLTPAQVDDVIALAHEIGLNGLVAANTTISRLQLQTPARQLQKIGAGGLSGKPLQAASTQLVHYIHQKAGGNLPIIASGGVFSGADACEKLNAGAALVEIWTGFIYKGPFIVKKICKHLNSTKL